jgi:hypothetical protein
MTSLNFSNMGDYKLCYDYQTKRKYFPEKQLFVCHSSADATCSLRVIKQKFKIFSRFYTK